MSIHNFVFQDIACGNNTCGTGVETKSANPPYPSTQSSRKSCDQVRCPSGTYCVNGNCVTSCDEVDCGPGKTCILENVNCFTSPCPPIPTCKPFDKCAVVRCKSGYTCFNGSCVRNCDGFVCGPNEECYLQSVQCIRAPCFPVPACRPILTCQTINCLDGYICVDRRCIPNPCKDFSCQPGQQCYLDKEKCTTTHCPPPEPVCRGSCANILCPTHTNCIDGQCISITTYSEEQA